MARKGKKQRAFTCQFKGEKEKVVYEALFQRQLACVNVSSGYDWDVRLLYKHQWNTKWAFPRKIHIFTREDNMLSSHVKRSPSLWLHNKSRLWKQADLVFHWCLYNKQNIAYSLMDMNFIFSCSTPYLTRSLRSLVRYRFDHSKKKFISYSTRGHVKFSMYVQVPLQRRWWTDPWQNWDSAMLQKKRPFN